jgi:putative endonuclease
MYTIYALVSKSKNWIYVGFTANINDRLHRHVFGYEQTTAPYRPFICILLASAFDRNSARKIEKWYKTSYGKSVIRLLFKENILPPFHGEITGLSANR